MRRAAPRHLFSPSLICDTFVTGHDEIIQERMEPFKDAAKDLGPDSVILLQHTMTIRAVFQTANGWFARAL
jgi:hypothetical protein